MADTDASPAPAPGALDSRDLYRAVWRWHFYAGLLVLPFLVWLATTGALYVFHRQIDAVAHRALLRVAVPAPPATARPASALVAAALAAQPGTAFRYTPAASPTASAEVGIATAQGARQAVFVDPYRARVLGALPDQGTLGWTLRRLHSLKAWGPVARAATEIAAGWALLLIATGLVLWWPRGRQGGVVSVRGRPGQRMFWRDLHAVTGIFVGAALAFLAFTGLPWSGVWGAQVNRWANGHHYGYPAGVRVDVPMSQHKLHEAGPTAWSLEQAQVPVSAHAVHGEGPMPAMAPAPADAITLDDALAIFAQRGMATGYSVLLPTGPQGVYTASVYPDLLADQRVVHLDQYTGQALIDMRYADYGWLGRWLEWGINVHMGQEFGVPNQAVLVLACLGTVLLCVSGAVAWWKRRPAGGLGVPPLPADPRVLRGVVAVLAAGGVLFPLVGASLLVVLAADTLLRRRTAAATPARGGRPGPAHNGANTTAAHRGEPP